MYVYLVVYICTSPIYADIRASKQIDKWIYLWGRCGPSKSSHRPTLCGSNRTAR